MKYILLFVLGATLFSCNNQRVLLLPEVEDTEIREVLDVSTAYIFYDETQPDSTLFNRKNLIGTTNWLVNVDKRLTLKQAIPHIQYLQDKRRKASMHKNESAKNYFTCNDKSIENLGFIEFTNTQFNFTNLDKLDFENSIVMNIESLSYITFSTAFDLNIKLSKENMEHALTLIRKNYNPVTNLTINISKNLTFQDYIYLKDILSKLDESVSTEEFFF